MEERKKNDNNKEEVAKCWICKRTFFESLEEFNKKVLSHKEIDNSIKSLYKKGRKEFFPKSSEQFVEFALADIKGEDYTLGHIIGDIEIWLCPVCSGLLDSLTSHIDIDELVTKDDLDRVSISII